MRSSKTIKLFIVTHEADKTCRVVSRLLDEGLWFETYCCPRLVTEVQPTPFLVTEDGRFYYGEDAITGFLTERRNETSGIKQEGASDEDTESAQ